MVKFLPKKATKIKYLRKLLKFCFKKIKKIKIRKLYQKSVKTSHKNAKNLKITVPNYKTACDWISVTSFRTIRTVISKVLENSRWSTNKRCRL